VSTIATAGTARRGVWRWLMALGFVSLGLALPAAQAQVPEKKVLRVTFYSAESSFDPAKISDLYSRTVTPHIFEALYAYDPLARPARVVPLTAAAMPEHSPDFRTWTIHLKPGIYFQDDPAFKGQRRELVAEDYIYSLKRIVDPANKSPIASYLLSAAPITGLAGLRDQALRAKTPLDYRRSVEGMQAIDRYTLRFKLDTPRPRFVETLAASDIFGAVAREVVEHYGDSVDAHPVGTGPFRLKQWRRSSLIVLERNPQYRECCSTRSRRPTTPRGRRSSRA